MLKYFEKRKLIKFREYIEKNKYRFDSNYMEAQKERIRWLDWLIASYDNRAGDPKILLESLLRLSPYSYANHIKSLQGYNFPPKSESEVLIQTLEEINFIYHWVYHKEIIGF